MMKAHRVIDLLDNEFHVLQQHITLLPREAYMNYLFAPKVKVMSAVDKLTPESFNQKKSFRIRRQTRQGPGELLKRKWTRFEELRLCITAQAKRLAGFQMLLTSM